MLRSDLTPAVKLLLVVLSVDMDRNGLVIAGWKHLAERLAISPRAVTKHLRQARDTGWLTVAQPPARGRLTIYAAANGGTSRNHRWNTRQVPPLRVVGGTSRATDSYGKPDNGGTAPATVPIETPVQGDAVATGARHRRTAAAQTKGAPRRGRGSEVVEGQPEAGRVGGPGADGEAPGEHGAAAAAHDPTADPLASRPDHKRPDWLASFVEPDDPGWPPPEPDDLQDHEVST